MREMRDVNDVKKVVAQYTLDNLPAYLARLRALHGFSALELPTPARVTRNELRAFDVWPTVSFSAVRTQTMTREEPEDGDIVYQTAYSMRAFVWCRAEGWDGVIDARDRLTGAVRRFLIDHPTLGDIERFRLDETDIVEEFSDVTKVKGDRFVAGSFIAFTLVVNERVSRPVSGTVQTVELDETGVHPALA